MIDIERNPRQAKNSRLNFRTPRGLQMQQKAVVTIFQRDAAGRGAEDGVGTAPVVRRHDDEIRLTDVSSKDGSDLSRGDQGNVTRYRKHSRMTLRSKYLGGCGYGSRDPIACTIDQNAGAEPGGEGTGRRIECDNRNSRQAGRSGQRRQHILEHGKG